MTLRDAGQGPGDAAPADPPGEVAPQDASARIVVTNGGLPDAAELAALVVALWPAHPVDADTGPSPWRHAALLEAAGRPRIPSPGELAIAREQR